MAPGRRNHPGDDPAGWPMHLRLAVEAHGGDAVYEAGIAALGYPPTWTVGPSELAKSGFAAQLTKRSMA